MTTEPKTYAAESGHFYTPTGEPAYEVPNKSKPGTMRGTTVRDAKKMGLVPSVTTVLQVIAKPGLESWKMQQVLLASLTLPMIEGETLEAYSVRVMADSKEQCKNACNLGTLIHGEIEKHFTKGTVLAEYLTTCAVVESELLNTFGVQPWAAERSFACDLGYGGKCDIYSPEIVVDFKTKPFTSDNLPKLYDEHHLQLAAYRYGLGVDSARCAICFVSTIEPIVHIIEIDEVELQRGFNMFKHALEYWKEAKKYDPTKISLMGV